MLRTSKPLQRFHSTRNGIKVKKETVNNNKKKKMVKRSTGYITNVFTSSSCHFATNRATSSTKNKPKSTTIPKVNKFTNHKQANNAQSNVAAFVMYDNQIYQPPHSNNQQYQFHNHHHDNTAHHQHSEHYNHNHPHEQHRKNNFHKQYNNNHTNKDHNNGFENQDTHDDSKTTTDSQEKRYTKENIKCEYTYQTQAQKDLQYCHADSLNFPGAVYFDAENHLYYEFITPTIVRCGLPKPIFDKCKITHVTLPKVDTIIPRKGEFCVIHTPVMNYQITALAGLKITKINTEETSAVYQPGYDPNEHSILPTSVEKVWNWATDGANHRLIHYPTWFFEAEITDVQDFGNHNFLPPHQYKALIQEHYDECVENMAWRAFSIGSSVLTSVIRNKVKDKLD